MKPFFYCLFFLLFVGIHSAKANYLQTQLLALQDLSDEAFLEAFSYEALLKQAKERPPKYYAELERLLKDYQRPAGSFFLQLAEQQLAKEPIDIQNKEQLLSQLELGQFLIQKEERTFQIASDIVFGNLAEQLEKGFQEDKLKKTDAEIMYLVEQLKAQDYGVSIPVSDVEKGLHHLKQGNIKYIWSRLWFDHPILCVLGIISLLGILYFIIRKIRTSWK